MTWPPLLVHLLFHPQSDHGRALAATVHHALNDDPAVPGLRIPTVFCAESGDGSPPAGDYALDAAERHFIIVFADLHVQADEAWCEFFGALWQAVQAAGQRMLPFQLHETAWPLDPRLRTASFVRAFAVTDRTRDETIVRRTVTELCRCLHGDPPGGEKPEAPTQMFISHTKMDVEREPRVVAALKEFLRVDQPVKGWFDSGDIAGGSRFAEEIEKGIEDSSLLCVLTDHYDSREWCRREMLLAKARQRPIVVVDALSTRTVRSFPYGGNVPALRWSGRAEEAIDLLLKETLRHLHAGLDMARHHHAGDVLMTRAPELLTVTELQPGATVLYPDPPLGEEELGALSRTGQTFTTPLERIARAGNLRGLRVALSVSESTDIRRFGLDSFHQAAATLEIARYLLLRGATLVYGGHLGSAGYTEQLVELVRTHNARKEIAAVERLHNYVGWPLPLTLEDKGRYREIATLTRVPRPAELDETDCADFVAEPQQFMPAERSALHRYAWARGMTAMREQQVAESDLRVVVGGVFGPTMGRLPDGSKGEKWYASRIPGVLEEVLLSMRAAQPVFLIGAFGGVAALVADLIEGREREEMSWDYQRRAPFAEQMRDIYRQRDEPWLDYPEMNAEFRAKRFAGLNTLLEDEEQRQLLACRDPLGSVELILAGLDRMDAKPPVSGNAQASRPRC